MKGLEMKKLNTVELRVPMPELIDNEENKI
jgi:hypothetical protein